MVNLRSRLTDAQKDWLRVAFGDTLQEQVSLYRFTAARLGGPAEALLEVRSSDELADVATRLWNEDIPFRVLGGGSNVLVSDRGMSGVVILNRAKAVRFDDQGQPPSVWAESGANLGLVARQAAQRGLSGLEWAAAVPGTVGGAVVGNAGAFGGDMAGNLIMADILQPSEETPGRREGYSPERMAYGYRTSFLKKAPGKAVVLGAHLALTWSEADKVQAKMDAFGEQRRRSQPPGASMGSMFKNPPGDHAGRLIEAAGLKGTQVGGAEISSVHANFFINRDGAKAEDLFALIQLARQTVREKFGIELELEVEILGDWEPED